MNKKRKIRPIVPELSDLAIYLWGEVRLNKESLDSEKMTGIVYEALRVYDDRQSELKDFLENKLAERDREIRVAAALIRKMKSETNDRDWMLEKLKTIPIPSKKKKPKDEDDDKAAQAKPTGKTPPSIPKKLKEDKRPYVKVETEGDPKPPRRESEGISEGKTKEVDAPAEA